ncbi:MAG: NAD-dependent epimerase/dehydratase family protein [Lentisphaerales bacterium]|nr:MAG: NAD-dependent epimerase/dehydratase family protein [Lentisphaerales bacterium]
MRKKNVKIAITGANGFVGRFVLSELAENKHRPIAFVWQHDGSDLPGASDIVEVDIGDGDAVHAAVEKAKPDACIHLAAVSFVPDGAGNPRLTFSVNVMGTVNVLEAFRRVSPEARIVVVSTAQVYGKCEPGRIVTEDAPLRPSHQYGISKTAADLLALNYASDLGLRTMTARPHNHIGPGQSTNFVVASFARQMKEIADGKAEPRILVGNLESARYFTDVRDVARAYRLLIESGTPGRAYNISSRDAVRIVDVLETLCDLAGVRPRIEVDRSLFRPADNYPRLDTTRIEQDIGWLPRIPLVTSLRDILEGA